MRITGFHVDGFGLLSNLTVGGLGTGTTVVLGPNEAGKSTLHTFLVRTLFGHPRTNDARGRERHEPLHGGHHGGMIEALDKDGIWECHRYTTSSPALRVVHPSGTESTSADALTDLLGRGMNEDRYEQVFSINLDALASLGSLKGKALDELLLDAATVGAGQSLRRAIEDLTKRRDLLWTPKSRNPPLNAALSERRNVAKQLREAQQRSGDYQAANDEVTRLADELEAVRDEQQVVWTDIRGLKRLQELWPTWQALTEAETNVSETVSVVLPDGLADEVENLQQSRDKVAQDARDARTEADRLHAAAEEITVDDKLDAVANEVAAHARGLGLQGDRRARLEQATAEARTAAQAAETAMDAMPGGWTADRVATTSADPTIPPAVRGSVERLRDAERQLTLSRQTVEAATQHLATAQATADGSAAGVGQAPETDLRARQVAIATLRSALPALERVEADVPPAATTPRWVPLVAAVLTATLLLAAAVAASTGALEVGAVALIGTVLAGIVTIGTWRRPTSPGSTRSSNAEQAPDLRQQVEQAGRELGLSPPITWHDLENANLQTQDLADERRGWQDRQTAAERHEDAAKQAADELKTAEAQRDERQAAFDDAFAAWLAAAASAGLDRAMDPAGAFELLTAIGEARRAIAAADRAEQGLADLAREVRAFDDTTAQLCATTDRPVDGHPDAQLARLAEDCESETESRDKRAQLAADADSERATATRLEAQVAETDESLQTAYRQVGCSDAEAFAQAVSDAQARKVALEERDRADRMLRQQLGDDKRAEQLRSELRTGQVTTWADELAELELKATQLQEQRDALVRQHNNAEQELRAIGTDDAVAKAASELEQITERCRELAEQWATADLAAQLLAKTLERFEDAHQPAVLEVAGTLLAKATVGRWNDVRRIDEDLYVAAGGNPVPAHSLSRGATEQLYLCLRLALAEELNGSGPQLPLLIDDLMANADPERADGLASILADVATRQQLIVFTCNPATAERVVNADPTAGVLTLASGGSEASWQREPS